MKIKDLYDNLIIIIDDSINSVYAVCDPYYLSDKVKLKIREYTIEFAFLEVYKNWEYFLEQTFMSYSLNEISLNSETPECYINPIDRAHADRLIKGSALYPDWSDHEKVIALAESIFLDGEPYKTVLKNISSHLKEMKKIRNQISHNSNKSRDTFDSFIRNKLSACKVGISVSDFLIIKKGVSLSFIEIYFTYIRNSATIIANYMK